MANGANDPIGKSERRSPTIAPPLVVGVLVIAGWEAFCRGFGIPSYLFPAPSQIATTFVPDAPVLMRALGSRCASR